jgi:uncharacterized protein (TIGR02266 family)
MAGGSIMQQEKRVFVRVPVVLTAHCRIGNRFVRDSVADLSEGGLYLKTREPAREGTAVRVALALPHREGPKFCTLVGSVARVDRDHRGILRGLGVCFASNEIGSVDFSVLQSFIQGAAVAA